MRWGYGRTSAHRPIRHCLCCCRTMAGPEFTVPPWCTICTPKGYTRGYSHVTNEGRSVSCTRFLGYSETLASSFPCLPPTLSPKASVDSDDTRLQLSQRAVRSLCSHSLFIAGTDTTSLALSWAFYYLAVHPEMHARCRREALQAAPFRYLTTTCRESRKSVYLLAVVVVLPLLPVPPL